MRQCDAFIWQNLAKIWLNFLGFFRLHFPTPALMVVIFGVEDFNRPLHVKCHPISAACHPYGAKNLKIAPRQNQIPLHVLHAVLAVMRCSGLQVTSVHNNRCCKALNYK